jgi:hypothetical protein
MPEDFYRSHTRDEQKPVDEENVRSITGEPSNGKATVRSSGSQRERPERLDSYDSQQRKGSLSEAESQRRKPSCTY